MEAGTFCQESVVGWERRSNVVFSIGHMNRTYSIDRKGFDNVVRAIPIVARSIPDVRFVLAGTKGGEFYLDKLAADLGVSLVVVANALRLLRARDGITMTQKRSPV